MGVKKKEENKPGQGLSKRLLRRVFFCLSPLFIFLSLFAVALPQLQQVTYGRHFTTSEFELKAVYLYNFLHFVSWPEKKAELAEDNSFVIGVVGTSPIVEALAEVKRGLAGSGRRGIIIINHGPYRSDDNLDCCHLLFIGDSEQENFSKILAAVKGKPIMTVSGHDAFLAAGGMIHLLQYKGRVRWEINRRAILDSGLRFSAKLMDIAVNIIN